MPKNLLKKVINPKTGREIKINSKIINNLEYIINPKNGRKMKVSGATFIREKNLALKFERCVKSVKSKSNINPWAICHNSIKRKKSSK